MQEKFVERLQAASRLNRSLVCIGLDPDPSLMPVRDVAVFNKAIVDATKDLVCAYKPNLAFYEALGFRGLEALKETVSYIRREAPGVLVVGDGKKGDISSTNAKHAIALFEVWEFDAATVNGYAGGEPLKPFFEYETKGVFVWCRSSNPGAGEFQDLRFSTSSGSLALYEFMADRAFEWNTRGNVGLVVGSTFPSELKAVRARCPGMPILIPGVGVQSGDLRNSVRLGVDDGVFNILISSSRGIIYASRDKKKFADAARQATRSLRDEINSVLPMDGREWEQI